MNYKLMLENYIDDCPYDEPILIEDIKNYFKEHISTSHFTKVINSVYVYINRLVKNNVLVMFSKGVYYKPKKGKFGYKKLDANKVTTKKYIKDNNGVKGYITGAYLFNVLGLTTQMPKKILIMTNVCPNNNEYENKVLGVFIKRPKIKINEDNYIYLQLLDVLNNKENVKVEVDNEKDIIYRFIYDNNLKMDKIFKYANLTENKKAIEKLYDLGGW